MSPKSRQLIDYDLAKADSSDDNSRQGNCDTVLVGDREHLLVRRRDLPFGETAANPDDFVVLSVPLNERKPKLDFPKDLPLWDVGWAVSRGIAYHRVDRWVGELAESPDAPEQQTRVVHFDPAKRPSGFTARKLEFDELDLDFECRDVLHAHGWLDSHGGIDDLLGRVLAVEPRAEEIGRKRWGDENWGAYIVERASALFAEPLSRLWYAASMYALFYSGDEEFRLGYLWSEYRAKLRYEGAAFSHLNNVATARENGKNGGRAPEKRRRYDTLDQLFGAHRHRLPPLPERADYVRLAKQLAESHDRKTGEGLFKNDRGRQFPLGYYQDWYSDFRQRSVGEAAQALRDERL